MRIFRNVKEMVIEVEREIFEMGINSHPFSYQDQVVASDKNFQTKELIGYTYSLTKWGDTEELFRHYDESIGVETCMAYCEKEFLERISGASNPGTSWEIRDELWRQFLHDGKFAYTYSERMDGQMTSVVNILKNNPGSRQAIITIYDKHDDQSHVGGEQRIPCSMHYQFLLRQVGSRRLLTLIYVMRSCDYYKHFPIDCRLALMLLEYVAKEIDALPSTFIHTIGSLHAYYEDWKYRRIF